VILSTVTFWPAPDDTAAPVQPTPTGAPTAATPAAPAPGPATALPSGPAKSDATTSATPTLLPGSLTLSTNSVDLGRSATRATFQVTNVGDLPVLFQVSSHATWLRVSPIGGGLSDGGDTRVTVVADRSKVREGSSTARVLVSWDAGSATVTVSLDEERPPAVGAPTVPPGSSCDVDVRATVSDESGLATVTLVAGDASTTRMTRSSGSTWTARLHIAVGGSYTLHVVATDTRGNTTTGPSSTTAIDPCPQ
jgi:hypothetical protein